jgi:hypothetical protein
MKDPEKKREYDRQWRAKNRKACNRSNAEWRKRNPLASKHYAEMRRYNLHPGEKELLLRTQGNLCAVCRTDFPGKGGWHTDHDHVSGDVRGILCHNCNRGLGYLKDDALLLHRGIEYLSTGAAITARTLSHARSVTPHLPLPTP